MKREQFCVQFSTIFRPFSLFVDSVSECALCGEEWIDWRSNFEDDKEINEDDMTALQNSETAAGLENF